MKYSLLQKLTEFLDFSYNPQNILLIESDCYLKDLTNLLPGAKIFFASSDVYKLQEVLSKYSSRIFYVPIAYNQTRLPFNRQFFDIIMGDELLTENFNPQDIASGLGSFLTPTGYLLTTFSNPLFKPWLDKLSKEGRNEFIVRRGYTKDDFERLMAASFFKETFFTPIYEKGEPQNEEPPFYLVMAYKSVLPVRNLKAMYAPEIRQELAKLLHRIEYDADRPQAVEDLRALIKEHGIFEEYLEDFIKMAVWDSERVLPYMSQNMSACLKV